MSQLDAVTQIRSGAAARWAWPFYVVCDVSQSMWDEETWRGSTSPHTVMNDSLALMIDVLAEDDEASAVCHLCVITFAERATTHYPLTPMADDRALDPLPRGTWTNYEAVWEHAARAVREDVARLREQGCVVKQPALFFISDGRPGSTHGEQQLADWKPFHDALCDPAFPERPVVVSLGMGDVDAPTVLAARSLDPAGAACIAEPGEVASSLLQAVLRQILISIRESSRRGSFVFSVPPGMRRLDAA